MTQTQSMAELVRGHPQQILAYNNIPVFSQTILWRCFRAASTEYFVNVDFLLEAIYD